MARVTVIVLIIVVLPCAMNHLFRGPYLPIPMWKPDEGACRKARQAPFVSRLLPSNTPLGVEETPIRELQACGDWGGGHGAVTFAARCRSPERAVACGFGDSERLTDVGFIRSGRLQLELGKTLICKFRTIIDLFFDSTRYPVAVRPSV